MLTKIILIFNDKIRGIFSRNKCQKTIYPKRINIELTTTCNAICYTCPHEAIKNGKLRKNHMDFALFKKIIDEISRSKHKENIKEIFPFLYGEPFLYPSFIESLRYIRKNLPHCKIIIYSNGSVINNAEEIIKEKLIDSINFSLDASNEETYKKVRGLDYNAVSMNIHNFIKINKKYNNPIITSVSFVINDKNIKECKAFIKYWKKFTYVHFGCDDGRINKPFLKRNLNKPCRVIFEDLTILSNGKVALCCMDWKNSINLGELNNQTIDEIWNSNLYEKIRDNHLKKQRNLIPLCKNCSAKF